MKKTLTLFAVATLLAGCGETYDSTTDPAINEPSGSAPGYGTGTITNDNSLNPPGAATNTNQTPPTPGSIP